MKLLVAFFGLLAAASAISPIGQEVRDRAAQAFVAADIVNVPRISLQTPVQGVGLVDVHSDPQLNCAPFGHILENFATEEYVTINVVGLEEHFELELEAAFPTDVPVLADITVELLGIPLGLGDCLVVYSDVVMNLKAWGAYSIGNPSSALIFSLQFNLSSSGGVITTVNGGSLIVQVLDLLSANYPVVLQLAVQDTLKEVLEDALL